MDDNFEPMDDFDYRSRSTMHLQKALQMTKETVIKNNLLLGLENEIDFDFAVFTWKN
ncbi:Protein CBG18598 [Caenorhabditis briggsae]|uniref:Protein CBG18598 n=1 Tax=Caenorhabditis briggsae TaxID=6238 RepID=A8XTN9_CAEBR|nr:Protein CBG18598 [Caenorhabditis briggsae]CAP36015.1 Protein CBG18598 [Caenorhabditis briggsae]